VHANALICNDLEERVSGIRNGARDRVRGSRKGLKERIRGRSIQEGRQKKWTGLGKRVEDEGVQEKGKTGEGQGE